MDTNPQPQRERDGVLLSLNMAIGALNIAKDISGIPLMTAAFGSVGALLTMIRDSMINEQDYVQLGLSCADICRALDRGMGGKELGEVSRSVCEAIIQLTTTVAEIQRKIIKRRERNAVSRLLNAKNDKDAIAAWNLDLSKTLRVFNTELAVNAHVTLSDIRHDAAKTYAIVSNIQHDMAETRGQACVHHQWAHTRPGESPPSPPRACFGREEMINKIIDLTENLTPIALIGPGGIGKTSIALTILHHDRIKEQFGDNRRFLRCDQFPASSSHFLSRLSKVIGAGGDNPEDITPLRSFLSSGETIIVLDNAESILDPQGTDAQEIFAMVEELSRIETICLCITSRISTVPPDCETVDVPTLSMESSRDTFYRIYKNEARSASIDQILEQLEFHPLSITLLATVAHHSRWDTNRLNKEWGKRRTGLLHTQHNKSLATTIELSLTSPMFQELGPDARLLLGVVAFFPQGVDERNVDWLFPTIPDRTNVFDKFCILSLTYRSNGFITMLAPLRDYLRPKNPLSSPLLCAAKDHYFNRLSVDLDPNRPGFGDAQWITSEDVNAEHLLDVFTTVDAKSDDVWGACAYFMSHLYWHKRRPTLLQPKIEELPDDHPYKSRCMVQLSLLLGSVGNVAEEKRCLIQTLKIQREQGDDLHAARTLRCLAEANGRLGHFTEGIWQAKEALGIFERLGDVPEQAATLLRLSWLFNDNKQLEAAETAASRSLDLLLETGEQFRVCQCRCVLGNIYRLRADAEKAIEHFEAALGIASSFEWHDQLFWNHYSLAELFFDKGRFDEAHAHIERAKPHTINDPYLLGRATELQAGFWYNERKIEAAKLEALRAVELYENLGATKYLRRSKMLLRWIEEEMGQGMVTPDKPDLEGSSSETAPVPTAINPSSSAWERNDSPNHHPDFPSNTPPLPSSPTSANRSSRRVYSSHLAWSATR